MLSRIFWTTVKNWPIEYLLKLVPVYNIALFLLSLQPSVGSLMGQKSKATQSRALNLGESSKNPPNVMASDEDDDNNNFVLETLNPFTTLTTILQCLGGLPKGMETLIVNEASSLRMDLMHSVLFLNVRQELNTVAVVMFYSHSQTFTPRSLN